MSRSISISSPCRFHFVLYCLENFLSLVFPLSEFVNPYGRYNIRESSPAGLRLLGQYIYYDALVVHGRGDKLEGYGGKQNE